MHASRRRSAAAAAALGVAMCVAISGTIAHPVIAAGTGEFCGPGWQRISTPQVQKVTRFTDIAGVRDDLWAVGHHARGPKATPSTLAAHWDGSRWTEVPTPDPGDHTTLSGVAAVGPHDVWAVGTADGRALAEHWNGTTWSVVPTPDPPSAVEELFAVDAVSSDDVWAVGRRGSTTTHRSLTMHWNGSAWSVVPSPDPDADGNHLFGVDAVSPARAWAFGATGAGAATDHSPLLLRWNGVGWSTVETSSEAGDDTVLRTGMEVSGGDLWTAGGSWTRSGPSTGIVQRRRGAAWTTWANPSTRWEDADATSGDDLWVAGEGARASLTAHWDGRGWTSLAAPAHLGAAGGVASLHGTIAVSRGEVWVVGGVDPLDPSTTSSLALRACPMNVTDAGIARASSRVAQGSGTLWRFSASDEGGHEIADALGLGTGGSPLFTTGTRPAGSTGTFVLDHAGTFPIVDTSTGHTAELSVPTEALPKTAPIGTTFTVLTSARSTLPSSLGTDIRYRKPGSEFWYRLVSGTKSGATPFTPDQTGVYTFQARLRNTTTGTISGWSPFATFKVTPE